MQRSVSVIPPDSLSSLEGSIALTAIIDVLQFLNMGHQTGELHITETKRRVDAQVYLRDGEIVHVRCGNLDGLRALVEVLGWSEGFFRFRNKVSTVLHTVDLPFQHTVMEAMRIRDEFPRRNESMGEKTSGDVLQEILKVPGINAVVVVGRDGFLIESAGNQTAVDLESIGASLAHAINGVEEMGTDLAVDRFQDVFIEYGRAVILCKPAGDAIVAMVSPDASKLGIIRHKSRTLIEELGHFF
jgi:predicted regulator of Ras-like GTPase activity (Roadblock/LC7/MglB family)